MPLIMHCRVVRTATSLSLEAAAISVTARY